MWFNYVVCKNLHSCSPADMSLRNSHSFMLCFLLTADIYVIIMVKQITFGANWLQVLQLDLCGQCMLDIAFKSILDRCLSSFSRLAIVSLRGSCRLSDDGLRMLVLSAPLLRSINLGQCALLTSDAVKFIADVLGSELRELYIDECHKIDALQSLPAMKKFRHLEILSVAGIHSINDCFVNEIVTAFGQTLRELDFADCM